MKVSELEFDPNTTMADLEKAYILKALAFYDGNKTKAANGLGITIKTIYNRLHGYGLADDYKRNTVPKEQQVQHQVAPLVPPKFDLPSGTT